MEPDAVQRRLILCAVLALAAALPAAGQTVDAFYTATYLEVQPAAVRQAVDVATRYVVASRAERGNLRAQAFQEIGRNTRFVIIEGWADKASLDAHDKAAHTTDFLDHIAPIRRGPADRRVHRGFALDAMPAAAGQDAVYVVTHVDVPGARREEAEALLKRLHTPSLQDAGHVRYDIYQQLDPRTNHFTVVAAWNSRSAFDASGATPHALQFRDALGPMLGALYDERLYQLIR